MVKYLFFFIKNTEKNLGIHIPISFRQIKLGHGTGFFPNSPVWNKNIKIIVNSIMTLNILLDLVVKTLKQNSDGLKLKCLNLNVKQKKTLLIKKNQLKKI